MVDNYRNTNSIRFIYTRARLADKLAMNSTEDDNTDNHCKSRGKSIKSLLIENKQEIKQQKINKILDSKSVISNSIVPKLSTGIILRQKEEEEEKKRKIIDILSDKSTRLGISKESIHIAKEKARDEELQTTAKRVSKFAYFNREKKNKSRPKLTFF